MGRKRKLDFVIYEDTDIKRVFRFYPRKSHCHSFNEEPPKTWEDVYKVYYSYAILELDKEFNETEVLFNCHCDECSAIDEVSEYIRLISDGKTKEIIDFEGEKITRKLLDKEIRPFGYGVTWIIRKRNSKKFYNVELWDNNEKGYRIILTKDELKNFGLYLRDCCEYMLKNGEPI